MDYKCSLETRHSTKKNTDYKVFSIKITDTYEILHFPTPEQLELIKLYSQNTKPEIEMPDIPFFTDSEKSSLNN